MKKLFKTSTKTVSEAELFLLASELTLSELITKKGFSFNEDQAQKQIQKIFNLLKKTATV